MNERLLHYIWQFRYFNTRSVVTTCGQAVEILHTGEYNTDQGPDFSNARIKLNDTLWAGAVELHVKTSDWHKHGHSGDARYQKLVLHVVWQHDLQELPANIPVLVLEPLVPAMMLQQYEKWMSSQQSVPCSNLAQEVSTLTWTAWKDRMLAERLHSKIAAIEKHLAQTDQHWEEVFWRMLCRYFGGAVNGESFEQLAISLPVTLLARHKNQIHQLEALLLGQAGLLHKGFTGSYPVMLYNEYQFLQKKYGLRVINKPPSFLRMRPVNFPTIRLAQLAMLIHRSSHLFSQLKEAESLQTVWELLDAGTNDYWLEHFKPDEPSERNSKNIGRQTMHILAINAIIPTLFAYGKKQGEEAQCIKVLEWLQQIPAEKNQLIAPFISMQAGLAHAHDSQALLHLRKQYCDARRCLECGVGNALLRKNTAVALSPRST
ncbi:MAG TPA: DUF2851 family protein [Phnomibacter sp.]|nr:DUF2851 family protein [Phnomibacter sp.]